MVAPACSDCGGGGVPDSCHLGSSPSTKRAHFTVPGNAWIPSQQCSPLSGTVVVTTFLINQPYLGCGFQDKPSFIIFVEGIYQCGELLFQFSGSFFNDPANEKIIFGHS